MKSKLIAFKNYIFKKEYLSNASNNENANSGCEDNDSSKKFGDKESFFIRVVELIMNLRLNLIKLLSMSPVLTVIGDRGESLSRHVPQSRTDYSDEYV